MSRLDDADVPFGPITERPKSPLVLLAFVCGDGSLDAGKLDQDGALHDAGLEWIRCAALAIKAELPLAVLRDTVAQFPTNCEAYLKAVERLEASAP